MSFILDALKKSENERQQQTPAEFRTVPASPDSPAAPRWLWVLGALLAINLVAVVGLMLRTDTAPAASTTARGSPSAGRAEPVGNPPTDQAGSASDAFAVRLEEARLNLPRRPAAGETVGSGSTVSLDEVPGRPAPRTTEPASPASSLALLPSLTELRLNGELQLPEMHIDLHVFDQNPNDRFVFINTKKYRERDRLSEGPVVEQITRDGVVLDYRGRRFVLPRD